MKETKEHKSKALQMEYRVYKYSRTLIFSYLVIALSFFIFAFILGLLEKDLALRIPGISLFLTGLYFVAMFIHVIYLYYREMWSTEDIYICGSKGRIAKNR